MTLPLLLYQSLAYAANPAFNILARLRAKRGKDDPKRLRERNGIPSAKRPDGALLWCHAASLGETSVALTLARPLLRQRPRLHFLLTTATLSAADAASKLLPLLPLPTQSASQNNNPPLRIHQYAPHDSPQAASRFLQHWKPSLALRVESELWPAALLAAQRKNVPLALINARLSPSSFARWRRAPKSAGKLLRLHKLLLAQSPIDARRLQRLGGKHAQCLGNLKYDAPSPKPNAPMLKRLQRAVSQRDVWIALSVHPPEASDVLLAHRALRKQRPKQNPLLILLPRHPHKRQDFLAEAQKLNLNVAVRSANQIPKTEHSVFLADSFGETSLFCQLAHAAFIGGTLLPHGGQNPLDAARAGIAVIAGPSQFNFRDVFRSLQQHNALLRADNHTSLTNALLHLLNHRVPTQIPRDALKQHTGAVNRILPLIASLIPNESESHAA